MGTREVRCATFVAAEALGLWIEGYKMCIRRGGTKKGGKLVTQSQTKKGMYC